jgi:hypothetical protein
MYFVMNASLCDGVLSRVLSNCIRVVYYLVGKSVGEKGIAVVDTNIYVLIWSMILLVMFSVICWLLLGKGVLVWCE